jgi:hypothetical protein
LRITEPLSIQRVIAAKDLRRPLTRYRANPAHVGSFELFG